MRGGIVKEKRTDKWLFIELEEGDLPEEAMTHKLPVGESQRESTRGEVVLRIAAAAVEILGRHGRLISGSKSAYRRAYPDHEVLFNACVFDEEGTQIWFGDVDLTMESGKVQQLADHVGTVYLTPEWPYRFEGLPADRADDRIRRFDQPGAVEPS
jgi:hypothetical protein